jgi:phosphatidylserine/phosphatidylglycerophosphate/cardiolipin synthase-like enzyme
MFFRRAAVVIAIVVIAAGFQVPAHAGKFTPRGGETFNSPVGGHARQNKILDKIIRSIRSTPRGQDIRVMSWNIQSRAGVDALLRAQRRGVRVRVLMARSNATAFHNPSWERLDRGLHRGNRTEKRNSWARLCAGSCRGRGGHAHAKYFLFSRSGRARHVVIQGSANLTKASTANQWNDIYTSVNRERPYRFFVRIFGQMAKDRRARHPFAAWSNGGDRFMFFPGGRRDPVMSLLNKVKCRGAANTGSHRTQLRILPDSLREARGMKLGRKVWRLWQNGCDVRIGYTVMGVDVGRMLRRPGQRGRGVPMRHLVQDFDGDGLFDRYFHLKAMSIRGHVGRDRSNWVVLNGSANWSSDAYPNDENLGVYWREGITRSYQEHFSYWYNWPGWVDRGRYAMSARTTQEAAQEGRLVDGLLFGTAPINGVDPYANVDMD